MIILWFQEGPFVFPLVRFHTTYTVGFVRDITIVALRQSIVQNMSWGLGLRLKNPRILSTSLLQATEGQKFLLHVLSNAMSALAPETTLLDTAERYGRVGDDPGVYSDHTDLQRLGDSPNPANVSRIEIACEPDISVVRQLDHLLLSFEFNQSCDRSESLFLTEEC